MDGFLDDWEEMKEDYEKWKLKFTSEFDNDSDSRLGTYCGDNPSLEKYVPQAQNIMEVERMLVTRYRTGSHSLSIELGRYSNIPRMNRLCICGKLQSVWHLFVECPLTWSMCNRDYRNLSEIFADDDVHKQLLSISKVLKIPI